MLSSVHCPLTPYFQCVLLKRVRWLTVLVAILSKATIRLVTIPTEDGIHKAITSTVKEGHSGLGLDATTPCDRHSPAPEAWVPERCLHAFTCYKWGPENTLPGTGFLQSTEGLGNQSQHGLRRDLGGKSQCTEAHSLWQYMMSADIQTQERQSMFCYLSGDSKLFHCPLLWQKKKGWLNPNSLISKIAMTTNYLLRQVKALLICSEAPFFFLMGMWFAMY